MATHPLLDGLDLDGLHGLEIGALHHPLVPTDRTVVRYVDHATTEELRSKYAGHDEVDRLVEVDVVWGDRPLREALGEGDVDFVVASHVLEHVPDPITWLEDLAGVLAPGGVIALAVPDKRFCFDLRRRESDVAEVVEAHLERRTRPSLAATFDFWAHLEVVDGATLWEGDAPPAEPPRDEAALARTVAAAASDDYWDVHCWVFTPDSFLAILTRLVAMDLLPSLALRSFRPTAHGSIEFHVVLERLPDDLPDDERRRRQRAQLVAAPAEGARQAAAAGTGLRVSARERQLILAKRRVVERLRRLRPG